MPGEHHMDQKQAAAVDEDNGPLPDLVCESSAEGYGLRSHRELRVWRSAFELALEVYRYSTGLPAGERFGLTSQMRRAAVSIAANIAEGYGRSSRGEYRQFLGVSAGSLAELDTHIELSQALGYGMVNGELVELLDKTGRQLTALRRRLDKSRTNA
jgi:four helix bundle protein